MHWDIHKSTKTDRDLIVFCLRFKISLWLLLFSLLQVLICPRLRSQAKLAVYFKDMERVNFKLFPRPFNKLVVFNCICKKELVLQFPKIKIFLIPFNHQSHTHSHSEAITMPPFSQVPRFPSLLIPSWELQEGDQSPLLSIGVGPDWDWGLALGPYLNLWPFLVSWSVPPVSQVGAGQPESWNTGPKENPEYHQVVCLLVCFRISSLQPSWATSPVAQGPACL